MNLKIYEGSENYTATVVKLPIKQKVEKLDNLVKVTLFGNDCLISKDSPEGLYLFFPAECQLSGEFCFKNNLYSETQLNEDGTQKGYFDKKGRVRALKLKGTISTGFVIPLSSLHYINLDSHSFLKEGDEFNELNGSEICRKYVVPAKTQGTPGSGDKNRVNSKLADILIPTQFRFHTTTSHMAKELHRFHPEDIIAITDKWHGSSCILANVYVHKKLNWFQKILNKLGCSIPDKQIAYIYSSGKPKSNLPKGIEGVWSNDGVDYYSGNIWKRAMNDYRYAIETGISLYGELVGFTEDGGFIQKGYDYGCPVKDNIKVGDKVAKLESGKPFKSGNKWNTVKEIINHPLLNIPAFTFIEDDSYVECRRCYKFDY